MNKEQREILKLIGKLWDNHPTQRLGQLLENYIFSFGQRGDKTSVKLFYQQDEDTLVFLKACMREEEEGNKE